MILTEENLRGVQEALMDHGIGSYPAFDGSGLVVSDALMPGGYRAIAWGEEVGVG